MVSTNPNYSEYSLKELKEAHQSINKEKYPERYEIILKEIVLKQNQIKEDQKNNPVQEKKGISLIKKVIPFFLCAFILWDTLGILKRTFVGFLGVTGTHEDSFYSDFFFRLHLIVNCFLIMTCFLSVFFLFFNLKNSIRWQILWLLPQLISIIKKIPTGNSVQESILLRFYDMMMEFSLSIDFGLGASLTDSTVIQFNVLTIICIVLAGYSISYAAENESEKSSTEGVPERKKLKKRYRFALCLLFLLGVVSIKGLLIYNATPPLPQYTLPSGKIIEVETLGKTLLINKEEPNEWCFILTYITDVSTKDIEGTHKISKEVFDFMGKNLAEKNDLKIAAMVSTNVPNKKFGITKRDIYRVGFKKIKNEWVPLSPQY